MHRREFAAEQEQQRGAVEALRRKLAAVKAGPGHQRNQLPQLLLLLAVVVLPLLLLSAALAGSLGLRTGKPLPPPPPPRRYCYCRRHTAHVPGSQHRRLPACLPACLPWPQPVDHLVPLHYSRPVASNFADCVMPRALPAPRVML